MDREGSEIRHQSPFERTMYVLRALTLAGLVTVLYYAAPLDRGVGVGTVALLVAALIVFGCLLLWQIFAITRAKYPRLRAIETVALATPLFLVLFAATYFLLAHDVPGSFSEPLSRTDALYFTVSVFVTVGFGDVVPTSEAARALTCGQMMADLVVLAALGKAVFGAVKVGLRHRQSTDDARRGPGLPHEDAE
ncbi:potassium channel family protein [Streptomyces sp. NPDC059070]|uniref:potassium channel family protein n=1 Tax=unclassified Streptomyces TaxID=2593676 RepID=UPI0034E2F653